MNQWLLPLINEVKVFLTDYNDYTTIILFFLSAKKLWTNFMSNIHAHRVPVHRLKSARYFLPVQISGYIIMQDITAYRYIENTASINYHKKNQNAGKTLFAFDWKDLGLTKKAV